VSRAVHCGADAADATLSEYDVAVLAVSRVRAL
jgi:hypothetical protein